MIFFSNDFQKPFLRHKYKSTVYDYDAEMAKYMNSDMYTQSLTHIDYIPIIRYPIQGTVVFPPALQGLIVD